MNNKLLLIINPNSGDGEAKNWMYDIISTLSTKYKYITTYLSKSREDIINTLSECGKEYDAVVCSGGDGTLHEVLNGLVKSGADIPIGYIPTGTINDFAFSHNIPFNAVQCLDIIENGIPVRYDYGMIEGMAFTYVAAFGSFMDVCYKTSQEAKAMFGVVAYVTEALKKLTSLKSYRVKVVTENETIEEDLVCGLASNSKSIASLKVFKNNNPDMLTDGLLDITLIKFPKNIAEFTEAITAFMTSSESSLIYRTKAKNVTFYFEGDYPEWTADGEFGGSGQAMSINIVPKGMQIIEKNPDSLEDEK